MSLQDDHGQNGPSLQLPRADGQAALTDVWAEVLGQLLGETQGKCDKELRLLKAESATALAELRARIAELGSEFDRRVNEKLASLKDGAPGQRGADGAPGAAGSKGDPGPPGQLPSVRDWKLGISYTGAVVRHNGATWQCRCDTAAAPSDNCDDWVCLAAAGRDAKSWRVRGTWQPDVVYEAGDVVVTDCTSFVATCDNPSHCPGAGWQLLTAAKRGHKGEIGPRGERGPPGPPVPSIVGWALDRESYAAVPIMTDGTRGPILDLRPLFEQFMAESGP